MDKFAEGKAEGEELATHRIAKSMLEHHVAVDTVILSTGLTRDDVERMKASIKK